MIYPENNNIPEKCPTNANPFDDLEQAAVNAAKSVKQSISYQSEEIEEQSQRSRDWFKARLGKFTASQMPDLMSRLKNGELSQKALNVIDKVSIERTLTSEGIEMYVDEMMSKEYRQTNWGIKWEPFARKSVIERLGINFIDVTFGKNKDIAFFGGSADGVSECGKYVLELKCPYDTMKHERNRLIKAIDNKHEYYAQIQSHLLNYPDAESCIFGSFDPRRASPHNIVTFEVKRDKEYQQSIIETLEEAERIINESYK